LDQPKKQSLSGWKQRETAEISDQRGIFVLFTQNFIGFFERNLGRLIDRFACLRHKNRHPWTDVPDTIKTALALSNIEDFPELVQTQIMKLDNEKWEDELLLRDEWFSSTIIPLENNVRYLNITNLIEVQK